MKLEVGLFILRVYLGFAFFMHGLAKFQGGVGNTASWFDSIGLPGFAAYIVAAVELVGGLLLIVGFGTRYISALFFIILLVATLKVKLSSGFMGNGQGSGFELDLAYAVMAIFFVFYPASSLSLESKIGNKGRE
ncbi:DoxX family protein [Metabacillus halosaccharovorans]|uniref:DoxX family protein n=1 Tax=Metabacillus halosaccharovorans TaxID=930124 RepID=A0ABT3DIV7_9BACI|nr:DoxX family protein [Metabacillus halosaccharovorans]MCV9886984.1 DoxX family protein [Metabacillus halosaccharovorans]